MVLSSVDVRVLVHELENIVAKSWIVNIYEIPGRIFIFKIRQPQVGVRYLLVEPGKRIHLTNFNREMPKEPTNFARSLRSHLRNKMINWIRQQELDRLIVLNIGPDEGYTLVFELFGEGNIILVSPDNKIISALRYRKMRDRDIHPGREFRDMPAQDRDILKSELEGLDTLLKSYPKIVPALNQWLGLGPYYSRYLLKEAGIKKKLSEDLTEEDIEKIEETAKSLKERLENNEYDPVVYIDPETSDLDVEIDEEDAEPSVEIEEMDDQWGDESLLFNPEQVVKILPWDQPVANKEELQRLEVDNLWEALDIFYSSQEKQEIIEESEEMETVTDRLNRQLEDQINHKKGFEQQAVVLRQNADALYANFQPASELIDTIYNARKNNVSWEEISEKLELGKEKGMTAAQIYKNVEPSNAQLVLSLDNDGNNYEVKVDFRKSLTDNANKFYENAKKAERKAKGATEAIKRTEEKIANAKAEVEKMMQAARDKAVILKRRKAWYEKFHWTHAPNGTLIIGGYDASSNERLIKRYLDPEDIFVHANLQGASTVVIKSTDGSASDSAKKIAGQLAVSYSSGWKAKLPIADAFFVESEQVSLTPPSGEYLPKGSVMIYGEKNFLNDLPLELCIGIIVERNWARAICGPEECMSDADAYVKISPGDISRGKIAKQIKSTCMSKSDDLSAQKIAAIDLGEIAWYIPGNSKILDVVIKDK